MGANACVFFFGSFFFCWLLFYSIYYNRELKLEFIAKYKSYIKFSDVLISDSKRIELLVKDQYNSTIRHNYYLNDEILLIIKHKKFKYYYVVCTLKLNTGKRKTLCISGENDSDFTCNIKFPNVLKIKIKEENILKKGICYFILFNKLSE